MRTTRTTQQWQRWLLSVSIPTLLVFLHLAWRADDVADDTKLSPLKIKEARSASAAASLSSKSSVAAAIAAASKRSAAPLRSFLDDAWAEWGSEDSQFQTLVPPSEVDYGIERRMPWSVSDYRSAAEKRNNPDTRCDDILLFMPQMFARNGHGSQLNSYLLAAMIATYLGKAMVLLEAPARHSKYPNGSQFGCPIDAFANPEEFINFKGNDHSELEMRRDFPRGLKRLIVHPRWISRDCPIPTCKTFDYNSWDSVRKAQRDFILTNSLPREIRCEEDEGTRTVRVMVMGGEEVRQFFDRQYKKRMLDRSSSRARDRAARWASRLGATEYQSRVFARATRESDIWDYASALLARSGLVTFQPWIARDVKEFIRTSGLDLGSPHDAIHVRRGDKLASEAREEVVNYWHSQGYERQVDFPLNYIPFTHYLRLWETDCQAVWSGTSKNKQSTVRTIYLATDDPHTVKKEIEKLPRGQGGTTIVGGCERVKFVFSPDASHGSFHISDGGIKVDCVERYRRNIHSIADLMILTKSNTFVGEFNSNWGRIVRIFRTQLNDAFIMPDEPPVSWSEWFGLSKREDDFATDEPPVLVHDIRIAFAEDKPIPPPGW